MRRRAEGHGLCDIDKSNLALKELRKLHLPFRFYVNNLGQVFLASNKNLGRYIAGKLSKKGIYFDLRLLKKNDCPVSQFISYPIQGNEIYLQCILCHRIVIGLLTGLLPINFEKCVTRTS